MKCDSTIGVRVPSDLLKRLKRIAAAKYKKDGEVYREALVRYADQEESTPLPRPEKKEEAA